MINTKLKAIDSRDLVFHQLFSNLQGNILKNHGRNHTTHIFVKFDKNRDKSARKWVREFADKVTSCQTQLKETELFKRNKVSGGMFVGFLLSAKGYKYFEHDLSKFEDKSFLAGMSEGKRDDKNKLNDPPMAKWDVGFREDIHAMILLADPDPNKLGVEAGKIIEEVDKFGKIVTIEYGNAIRNAHGDGLEHFGYVDGISQPLFFKDEVDKYTRENTSPLSFDPSAELDLVLVNDPFVHGGDAFGSYFVFRKLEQNVQGFKKAEKKLGKALGLQDEDIERAGAMIVGRFEDGTPVTLSKKDGLIGSGAMNNFDYSGDSDGAKCPYHAHIRKSNPRSDNKTTRDEEKKRIMARRGITYGHRNVSTEVEPTLAQMPTEGVGLLFMSFQKSIVEQFEFIQTKWVNDEDFPNFVKGKPDGIDPIIGQDGSLNISTGDFAKTYGAVSSLTSESFNSFVKMKGGEYFFAPSIPFLKDHI
jgi:Dyp-type peroxidase family